MAATTVETLKIGKIEVPLIAEEDGTLPIISMQLVFSASGAIMDGKHPGLAALSADLLEEGTKKLGSVAFARELEERAIRLNVDAGRETFVFELSALKEQFEPGLKLLIDLLKEPNLTPETLEKIKGQSIGELQRRESDFDYVASRGLSGLMYEGTPLEHPSQGTVQSVQAITLEQIAAFLKTALVQERAIVLFGGDFNRTQAHEWSRKLVGALGSGQRAELPKIEAIKTPKEKLITRESEQAYVYFGSPFYMDAADDEAYKATVASYILGGGGFGSRIMEEVRVKRGFAYSAHGRVNLGLSSSSFRGHLQTKPENREAATVVVKEVIAEFVKKGVSEKELKEAKQFLLGAEPLRTETMSQRLSRAFNDFYRGKELGWSQSQLAKIETLSVKELNAFIAAHPEILELSFFVVTK
ncbi:MAG: M16 family metallopeptidase [Campylobacterales bacterium]